MDTHTSNNCQVAQQRWRRKKLFPPPLLLPLFLPPIYLNFRFQRACNNLYSWPSWDDRGIWSYSFGRTTNNCHPKRGNPWYEYFFTDGKNCDNRWADGACHENWASILWTVKAFFLDSVKWEFLFQSSYPKLIMTFNDMWLLWKKWRHKIDLCHKKQRDEQTHSHSLHGSHGIVTTGFMWA